MPAGHRLAQVAGWLILAPVLALVALPVLAGSWVVLKVTGRQL